MICENVSEIKAFHCDIFMTKASVLHYVLILNTVLGLEPVQNLHAVAQCAFEPCTSLQYLGSSAVCVEILKRLLGLCTLSLSTPLFAWICAAY